jgi:hypothetical protein
MQPPPELIAFNRRYNTEGEWTYANQDGLSQTRAGGHALANRGGRAGSNRGRTAGNRGADRGRGPFRNSSSSGQVRDAEASAASTILNQDGLSQTRAGDHALANRGGGRAGSNRGRTAGNCIADRGRGASRNSARTGQVRDAEAGTNLGGDIQPINQRVLGNLAGLQTFSDFFVPFLRSVFNLNINLNESPNVYRVLKSFWPDESDLNLDDTIISMRDAYSSLPMYVEIRNSISTQEYIDARIQEYLLLDFSEVANNMDPVLVSLRIHIENHLHENNVELIQVAAHNLKLAIYRFKIAFQENRNIVVL